MTPKMTDHEAVAKQAVTDLNTYQSTITADRFQV